MSSFNAKIFPWSTDSMLRNIEIENQKFYVRAVEKCEGSEMVPDLEANKFACHSFMDTERRHTQVTARDEGHYYSQQVE